MSKFIEQIKKSIIIIIVNIMVIVIVYFIYYAGVFNTNIKNNKESINRKLDISQYKVNDERYKHILPIIQINNEKNDIIYKNILSVVKINNEKNNERYKNILDAIQNVEKDFKEMVVENK